MTYDIKRVHLLPLPEDVWRDYQETFGDDAGEQMVRALREGYMLGFWKDRSPSYSEEKEN